MNTPQKPDARFDSNDILFYVGLLLMGIGLAFGVSWQTALIVVGALIAGTSIATSFFVTWLSHQAMLIRKK